MQKYFLNPYIGTKYKEGINGKRVLVLGASFYCPLDGNKGRERCKYYEDCAINQNSIKYNEKCPYNNGRLLSDSAEVEIDENGAKSYTRFYQFMSWVRSKSTTESFDEFWDKVAFTNYVQHMIGGRTQTCPSDLREDYFEMFVSLLDEFEKGNKLPDVVIVWGCVIDKPLKNHIIPGHPDCRIEIDDDKEGYIFKWKNFNGKDILFINIYHPSSGKFYTDAEWDNMYSYFKDIFNLD
jgi:hypothetical protein